MLIVFTQESFPQIISEVKYDLGNAYCDRIRGSWIQNLEQAITAFKAALQVYTHDNFPENWASAKRLVDLMASNDLYQGDAIAPEVESLLQQYEELQRQIDIGRDRHKYDKNRSETRVAFQADNEAIAYVIATVYELA